MWKRWEFAGGFLVLMWWKGLGFKVVEAVWEWRCAAGEEGGMGQRQRGVS